MIAQTWGGVHREFEGRGAKKGGWAKLWKCGILAVNCLANQYLREQIMEDMDNASYSEVFSLSIDGRFGLRDDERMRKRRRD